MGKYFVYYEIQKKNDARNILAEGNFVLDIKNFDVFEVKNEIIEFVIKEKDFGKLGIKKEEVFCIIKFMMKLK